MNDDFVAAEFAQQVVGSVTTASAVPPKPAGCYDVQHTTPFYKHNLDELHEMLHPANPEALVSVVDSWEWVHDSLVGSGGTGGLKKEFDDAIKAVLEHWSGSAAQAFHSRAKLISQNISNAAPYAKNVANALKSSAEGLVYYKTHLMAIQKPSGLESAGNSLADHTLEVLTLGAKGGRDDSRANAQLASGVPTQQVLAANADELSAGKECQLQGAIVMEQLGGLYRQNAASLGSPPGSWDESDPIPPPIPVHVTPVVPVPPSVPSPKPPSGSSPTGLPGVGHQSPGSANVPQGTLPQPPHSGISGGMGMTPGSTVPAQTPPINTGLDGLPTGPGTGGLGGGSGGLGGGSFGGGSVPGLGGGSVGGLGGAAGSMGAGSSGAGGVGGASGLIGGAGLGAGGASAGGAGAGSTGRTGMSGMGGAGGLGKGAKGMGAGSSGRGALARQRGGVVGAAKGSASSSEQGGSGLHRSRGGSAAGKAGKSGRTMMGGGHGTHGKREGKHSEGDRPDYLVEDEETWTPEQNVAPRVIE